MSTTDYSNQEALNKALNIYRTYMRSFIIAHLKKIPGTNVKDVVIDSVNDRRADEIERSLADRDIKSVIDIDDFPILVNANWEDAFEVPLNDNRDFRNQLWLIKTCRDQSWAHPVEGDAESEGTRAYLFLIADVLRKIKKPDKQSEVEAIRDELFPDTTKHLAEAEERLKDLESEKSEAEKCLADVESEKKEYEEKNAALSKQVDEKENQRKKLDKQLKRAKTQNDKYKKDIAGTKQRLEESEAAQAEYKNRLETTSKELKETHAERKETEERLATALNQLAAVQAAEKDIAARLRAVKNLFTVAAIGKQEVQEVFQSVYPPIETDSTVRILDRRGIEKKKYLLELLEQKQSTLIYVQSEERMDQLLTLVGPEKADRIGKCNERTSEAEETEILEKLEKGELIAVVSNTTLSTLTSTHCVKHFVFCHLVPGLDEFFRQCTPAFASEKHAYLHLIYNSEQDIEGLAQKYPHREALVEMYRELRKLAGANGDFIKIENAYSELDIEKPSIETGLAIFAELQLLERNGEVIKFLPGVNTDLNKSTIHRRGEKLKKETADFRVFQLERSIEQIWEETLAKLGVDSERVLREQNTHNYGTKDEVSLPRAFENVLEDAETQSEQSTETVESDSTASDADTEANQSPKPARATAKVTEKQVGEIRSRSTAGKLNSELAEEDSEKKPEVKQSEFWQSIRDGEFGALFAGKPVPISNEGWITKTIRNIGVCLYLTNQRCYVQIYFHGANGSERREKIMTLFPKSEYTYAYRDSPRETKVQFPVLDKGRKDQDDWDEIREKLVAMGTDIYNKIDASDL